MHVVAALDARMLRRCRATESTTSFSITSPLAAPGSTPPCPASMTMTGLACSPAGVVVLFWAARLLALGAGGGSLVEKLARSVGDESILSRAVVRRAGSPWLPARCGMGPGIDHDARLAGGEQAVAIGLDQAAPAGPAFGQAEAHVRHVDDEPVRVGQREYLIGSGRPTAEREARAQLVAADLGSVAATARSLTRPTSRADGGSAARPGFRS